MKYLLCIVYLMFSVSGLILIKLGGNGDIAKSFHIPILDIYLNGVSLFGIVCYGVSFLLYLGIINKFDLGVIVPIIAGVVNIAVVLASIFVFKETLSTNMMIGALIIIIGIFVMNI